MNSLLSVLSAVAKRFFKKSWTRFCAPDNNNVMRFPRKRTWLQPTRQKVFSGEKYREKTANSDANSTHG
jgi:hypothetical protein